MYIVIIIDRLSSLFKNCCSEVKNSDHSTILMLGQKYYVSVTQLYRTTKIMHNANRTTQVMCDAKAVRRRLTEWVDTQRSR